MDNWEATGTVGLVRVLPWHEMNFRDNVPVILVLTPIDNRERNAQWYVFAVNIAYSLVTDGISLQSSCEMKSCLRRTL